jgi:hypothetical protein
MLHTCRNGARGSVVDWGTVLQVGRSRDGVPIRLLDFFNLPNPSSRSKVLSPQQNWVPGITQRLKGGRSISVTNLPLPVSRFPRQNMGASTSTALWAFAACYRDKFTFHVMHPVVYLTIRYIKGQYIESVHINNAIQKIILIFIRLRMTQE